VELVRAIAGLTFLGVVTLIVGLWWLSAQRRRIRERLRQGRQVASKTDTDLLRPGARAAGSRWGAVASRIPFQRRLTALMEQAGDSGGANDLLLLIGIYALLGGGGAWLRTGRIGWAVLVALIAGSIPVCRLFYRRFRRLQLFEKQFPDALDMLTRSIRSGFALSQAIQVVAEEMPDPTAQEFRRVTEEIRVGVDPGDGLAGLRRRMPTDDTEFFCTAIAIQRGAGGNLAEILDRLSEVIRERFRLLSHARMLSAQARGTAVVVGVGPFVFAALFQFLNPEYFDPLLNSPLAAPLIAAGLVSEAIGTFMIWRIANIKV
jgi:tight adherence protein B